MAQETPDRVEGAEPLMARVTEIFERKIKPLVQERDPYDFVVIDVDSGDFRVGTDSAAMTDELRANNPKAQLSMRRVGFPVAHWIGGGPPRPGRQWLRKKP
jgi:hypothetical protein